MQPAAIFFLALLFFITLGFLLGGPIESFTSENYINTPEMPDLTKPVTTTNSDADQANVNYRSVLNYVQNNPNNVYNFVKDLKSKFFDEKCEYKNPMDVSNLTATYQPVF
jgi:hypothetical protein